MSNDSNINIAMMLPVGHTLQMGKYRIDGHLSSGGFGNTYVVTNTQFEERRAMKEFFMKGINERDGNNTTVSVSNAANRQQFDAQREKFKKEARRLRRLHHPNIVGVDDLFEENGTAYYVMDYVEGGSLAERVKQKGAFTEEQVRALLPPLLDALEYIHNQQMWHLDLKPGNILLTPNGQPMLIDFGASKQIGLAAGQSTPTGMAFTPGYAPSEQMDQNLERIGPWTDLYALGGTLYNLLTGLTPPSVSEIQESAERSFQFPSTVSPAMRQLIVWMMHPSRRHRPQSVAEVRRKLYSPSRPVQPPTSGNVTKPTPQPGRGSWWQRLSTAKKVLLMSTVTACLGLVAVLVLNGIKASAPQGEPDVETITVNGVSFKMVRVEGGTFTMGATAEQGNEADSNEEPSHRVTLSTFSIGETEVTQQLWEAVMGSNPSAFKGAQRPVEQVSWDDCQGFILELNRLTGRQFRLPTEAEWEYAARGGNRSTGCKYAGSNSVANVAWYTDNSGGTTHDVKTKQANELGLYDMNGNVWEWCQDLYGIYSLAAAATNPTGPLSGSDRVIRGGGWFNDARGCRVSFRISYAPSFRFSTLGLRLAL